MWRLVSCLKSALDVWFVGSLDNRNEISMSVHKYRCPVTIESVCWQPLAASTGVYTIAVCFCSKRVTTWILFGDKLTYYSKKHQISSSFVAGYLSCRCDSKFISVNWNWFAILIRSNEMKKWSFGKRSKGKALKNWIQVWIPWLFYM
jgi:hypothetical protein